MPAADVRRALRYLLLGLIAYLLVAYGLGSGVTALEVGVFLLGVVALVLAGARLMAD